MFYSQVTFRVTVSSVVMLFVKLTLQVTLVPWCSAEGLKVKVELCLCVTAVRVSVLKAVMFPVMWESLSPAPLHVQVILGSDPEQRPGAVQVSVVCCPAVRAGTITVGFWVRSNKTAVNEGKSVSFVQYFNKTISRSSSGTAAVAAGCTINTVNEPNMLMQFIGLTVMNIFTTYICCRFSYL